MKIKVFFVVFLLFAINMDVLYASVANTEDFNLSDFCTSKTEDIAPIINRLLKEGNVYIPMGEWLLESKIILPSGKKIYGAGKEFTILSAKEPLRMIEIVGDVNEVCNIYFKGANITDKDSYLIFKRKGTKNLIVRDCAFEGATGGIFINAVCDSIYIYGCEFSKMYPCKKRITSGYGIVFNHNDKYKERGVINGAIVSNIFRETVYRHSLYLQSCEDIMVRNNVFYSTSEKKYTSYEFQVLIRGGRNIVFEGNKISGGYGFVNSTESNYHGLGSNIIIRNNEFINNINNGTNMGIINIRFNNAMIYNNTFLGFNTTGIYIVNVDNVVIEGNHFELKPNANYPIIDLTGKRIESLTLKRNIITLPVNMKEPAVKIKKTKARSLIIENNIIRGGKVGIQLYRLQLDSLLVFGNTHDGVLCQYSKNSINMLVKYSKNISRQHPQIKVYGETYREVVENITRTCD